MTKPKLKQHHINRDWCKGCGICVEFCPKSVLAIDPGGKAVAEKPLKHVEEIKKNDDGDRDSDQPQQHTAHGQFLFFCSGWSGA